LGPLKALGDRGIDATGGPTVPDPGENIILGNQYLEWSIAVSETGVRSTSLLNKLTGRHIPFEDSNEILLVFSDAQARIEIPWWNVHWGKDNDPAPPDQEEGYLRGYHREAIDDSSWQKVCNLLLFDLEDPRPAKLFNGYAWFRCWFDLDRQAKGDELVLCLGGYDQQDWNQYWVYLNGAYVGHRSSRGRWRTPGEFTIRPDSPQYATLRFGSKNLLAVRTYQFDKRLPGMSEDISERFHFSTGDRSLCDQFISVGRPYLPVSDFRLKTWKREGTEERPRYVFELYNQKEQLEVSLNYELDQFLRRKWLQVRNVGKRERWLLDVEVDDLRMSVPASDGGYGLPVMVGEEVFAAIEHPAALNQGMPGRVRLRYFPGTQIKPGSSVKSKVAVVGVAPTSQGRQQFRSYVHERSPRGDRAIGVYTAFGLNPYPESVCWEPNEEQTNRLLDLLAKWQSQGLKFDYFVFDYGWVDSASDYTRFRQACFPEGPQKVIERIRDLGMKLGLWLPTTFADWGIGHNPALESSRVPAPGGKWPEEEYQNGFLSANGKRHFCLASEPFFSTVRDAILKMANDYNLRLIKPDTILLYCNNPNHAHLPGKYSTEACFEKLMQLAETIRNAGVNIMWYGVGARSPFMVLYGNSMWESGLAWEASSTADYPVLFFNDGINLACDQNNRFMEFVPPLSRDNFGVRLDDSSGGNFIGKERWRERLISDLGRGTLLFPQFWGNLHHLDEEDVKFLARINNLVKENESVFVKRRTEFGDPWKNEPYGYSYFQGAHGFIFISNCHFTSRPISFQLGGELGLESPPGTPLLLRTHFPKQDIFVREGQPGFNTGETVSFLLRPFEMAMLEVLPAFHAGTDVHMFGKRELPIPQRPEAQSFKVELQIQEIHPGMETHFVEAENLGKQGYEKRIYPRSGRIPRMEDGPYTLAVVLRLRKDDKWWRREHLLELLQIKAMIGNTEIHFEPMPGHLQWNWASWLVFRTPASSSWANEDLRLAVTAYLPREVECSEEVWLVPNWWQ
jgi:hypothetical protein